MDQAALASRYGSRWNFGRLTERQRELLSDDSLYSLGTQSNHQVWISEIGTEGGRPILRLQDTLYYLFHRNRVSTIAHSGERIPVYKRILDFEEEPVKTETERRTGHTYLFDLKDSGQVVVCFDSVKETV